DDAGEPVDRADGEVEPAGDEDERPGDGDDQRRRPLVEDVEQVDPREEDGARGAEHDEERDEGKDDAVVAQARELFEPERAEARRDPSLFARGHAILASSYTSSVANDALMTASSVISSPSRRRTISPPRITSTRCASSSTSSSSDEMIRTAMPSDASEWMSS